MYKNSKEEPDKLTAGTIILCIIVDAFMLFLVAWSIYWLEDFLPIMEVLLLVLTSVSATWLTCVVIGMIRQWQALLDEASSDEAEGGDTE